MTRTTPPRPVDIVSVFPELANHARTATRLHPRPGSPGLHDSSIGGPLLWPADEPWPMCTEEHEPSEFMTRPDDERRKRRIRDAARGRSYTPEERAELQAIETESGEPTTPPEGPMPFMGFAQLYARDVPDLVPPPDADVLQVLWCPWDHDKEHYCPTLLLRWRKAADVADVIDPQPEPEFMEYGNYLPNPCVLHPEQVVEYQYIDFLPPGLQTRLREWEEETGNDYQFELSIASGTKVGGWSSWHLTDPYPMVCECGADMELLLRIDGFEWDSDQSWRPLEEDRFDDPYLFSQPTGIIIGRGYGLWVFTCPVSYDHPHRLSMQ
jgi:hypothetical protein